MNKLTTKLILTTAFCTIAMVLLGGGKASANHMSIPGTMPQYVRDTLIAGCGHSGQSPAFGQWISLAGQPDVTTIDVDYLQTSVSLQLNFYGIVCYPNSGGADETRLRVLNAIPDPPGTTSGIINETLVLTWTGGTHQNVGEYRQTAKSFTYSPNGGFTASGTYAVTLDNRVINHFAAGGYGCVHPLGGNPGGWNYNNCPVENPKFSVQINVKNTALNNASFSKIPTGSLTAADISGFNVRVRQPSSGANYNQVQTGMSGIFTSIPSGSGTVSASATTGIEIRVRSRLCNLPSSCGAWSGWSSWADAFGQVVFTTSGNQQVDTQIEYQSSGGGGGGGPIPCPSLPDPTVDVALPDQSPGNNGAPSGLAGSPGQTYIEYRRQNKTVVTSVEDISPGGNRVTIPLVSEAYQTATIDYSPYVTNYPYDRNQARVYYDSYYNQYTWTSSSSPTYGAPYWHDNNNNGINDSGEYYADIIGYAWTGPSGASERRASSNAVGPVMEPCYNRTYNAFPLSSGASLTQSNEEPVTADFGYSFNVNFALTQLPPNPDIVRERSRVTLPYRVEYYIDRWDVPTGEPVLTQAKTTTIVANTSNAVSSGSANDSLSLPAVVGTGSSNLRAGDRFCFRIRIPTPSMVPGGATGGIGQIYVQGQNGQSAGVIIPGTTSQERFSDYDSATAGDQFTCTEIAVNKPYFKAYGGDVVAGSNFRVNNTCSPTANAGITAQNRGTKPAVGAYGNSLFGGAGTQLAAYATGLITDFSTSSNRTATPIPMVGLAFSNSSNPEGNWVPENIGCMADYFYNRSVNAVITPVTSPLNLPPASGSYSGNGPFTFGGGTIPAGPARRYTLYVNGDLAITGDIRTAQANPTYSGANILNEISSVRLIATGNIYIDPSVTTINAVLVSQGGTIFTCSRHDNDFAPATRDQIANPSFNPANTRCRSKLTVYGALLANSIRFYRSNGSIRNSNRNEQSTSTNISEVIIYSPEVWLSTPSNIPPNRQPYDSYVGLPPIL